MEDYEIITRLGGGSFADVFKALEKSTGEYVAIKVLKKKYNKWEDCLELRECRSLQKLQEDHLSHQPGTKHIIKLKQIIFIKESGTLNLIFEYMEKDLFELMKSRSPKKMSESQIRNITYQTLLGLSFMHKYGFFHRDMKPENLLVIGDTVKIADFGLAREIRSVPPYTEYVSTRYYRAPECILKSTNYNSPVDIWALGCIMAEMYLHPQPLFFGNNEKEVLFKICSILGTPTHSTWAEGIQQAKKIDMKFPNFPGTKLAEVIPQASSDAIDLMYQMLNWDPNKRATAYNLLQHPFFTNYSLTERISTPEYSSEIKSTSKTGIKKYTNNKGNIKKSEKAEDDSINKLLNDTEGFDKLINQLKHDKIEEEKEYKKKYEQNDNFFFQDSSIGPKKSTNVKESPKPSFAKDISFKPQQNQSPLKNNVPIKPRININDDDLDSLIYSNNKEPVTQKPSDFDTNVRLKPEPVNNRRRSARNFIENTNNEINFENKPSNQFQFNNNNFSNISSSTKEPMILNSDFPSRRKNNNINSTLNPRYNDIGRILDNDDNMIIGDSYKDSKKQSPKEGNDILFGMKSRRSHNFK